MEGKVILLTAARWGSSLFRAPCFHINVDLSIKTTLIKNEFMKRTSRELVIGNLHYIIKYNLILLQTPPFF